MITTSRRTPRWAVVQYSQVEKDRANIWVWNGYKNNMGENPYFAFLGAADAILVTQDSTNMLTEACATGKPVFTLPMSGASGKFKTLYSELKKRCHVSTFNGDITAPSYPPLDETARIAKIITDRLLAGKVNK